MKDRLRGEVAVPATSAAFVFDFAGGIRNVNLTVFAFGGSAGIESPRVGASSASAASSHLCFLEWQCVHVPAIVPALGPLPP
jgi:hypothetical protein